MNFIETNVYFPYYKCPQMNGNHCRKIVLRNRDFKSISSMDVNRGFQQFFWPNISEMALGADINLSPLEMCCICLNACFIKLMGTI